MTLKPSYQTLGENLRWGLTGGLVFGVIYCLIAVGIFVVGGREAFERQGTTFAEILGLYLGGGLVAGAVVGLLRPVASRSRPASLAAGVAAALPVAVGVTVLVADRSVGRFGATEWITAIILALLFGLYGGGMLWKYSRPS